MTGSPTLGLVAETGTLDLASRRCCTTLNGDRNPEEFEYFGGLVDFQLTTALEEDAHVLSGERAVPNLNIILVRFTHVVKGAGEDPIQRELSGNPNDGTKSDACNVLEESRAVRILAGVEIGWEGRGEVQKGASPQGCHFILVAESQNACDDGEGCRSRTWFEVAEWISVRDTGGKVAHALIVYERLQKVANVICSIRKTNKCAAFVCFCVRRSGKSKHVGEYGGMVGEKPCIHAEDRLLRLDHEIGVREPEALCACDCSCAVVLRYIAASE